MFQSLLLVLSVCIDTFVASVAYGTNKIKIPPISSIIISLIGSLVLGISLLFGGFITDLLPRNSSILLSFAILMFLGVYRLFEGICKNFIQKKRKLDKPVTFKIFDFNFALQVYADETKADFDKSKLLSPKEAFYLAFALSFDSLEIGYLQAVLLGFVVGIIVILLGVFIGKKAAENTNLNLSWLSGVILMILAINKLF